MSEVFGGWSAIALKARSTLPRFTPNSAAIARMLLPSDLSEWTCCNNFSRSTTNEPHIVDLRYYTPGEWAGRDTRDIAVTLDIQAFSLVDQCGTPRESMSGVLTVHFALKFVIN